MVEVEQGQEGPKKPEAAHASYSGVLGTVLLSAPVAPGLPGEERAQAEARLESAGKAGDMEAHGEREASTAPCRQGCSGEHLVDSTHVAPVHRALLAVLRVRPRSI